MIKLQQEISKSSLPNTSLTAFYAWAMKQTYMDSHDGLLGLQPNTKEHSAKTATKWWKLFTI
jgi:hypothetical protein